MGYRPKIRAPRAAGRGNVALRDKKYKAKERKPRYRRSSTEEENHVPTAEEVAEQTLKRLRTLGSQKFASSPYSEHFDRWLMNLTGVLSEFELTPTMSVDPQFTKERSQILSNIEFKLNQKRLKEIQLEEAVKSLSDSKNVLEGIKMEYAAKARAIERRKNSEIRRLQGNINSLKEELDNIARMKTGILRGISKKKREQKEAESTQEIITKERELELAMMDFSAAREKLRDKYENMMQPVIAQIKDRQKKIETLETDDSLEDRWFACEALVDMLNSFMLRKILHAGLHLDLGDKNNQ